MITYSLTSSQWGIFVSCRREPESTAYQLPVAMPFSCGMDGARLAAALREVAECRSVLHTRLVLSDDNVPRQYSDPAMHIEVPCRHVTEAEALAYMEHGFVRPFDLFGPLPLCRFEVLVTEAHTWLLMDIHHVISDGMTISQLLMGRDVSAAIDGITLTADNLSLYEEAELEQRRHGTDMYQTAKEYYRELFGETAFSVLPSMGEKRTGEQQPATDLRIPRRGLDQWCETHHVAPNLLFMAAYSVVLSNLCYSQTVAYATLSHGRNSRRLRQAYGMFVKTVPFVADVDPEATLADLMGHLRRRLASSVRHAAYPYVDFCRDHGQTAMLTFAFQGADILEQMRVGGETVVARQLPKRQADSGMSCVVYTFDDIYEVRLEAGGAHLDESLLQLFARSMEHCLKYIVDHPDCRVGDVELVDDDERKALLALSQGETSDDSLGKTIVGMIDGQTTLAPDATAVADGTERLSYRQLQGQSCTLARLLMSQGVKPGDFVGIDAVPCCGFLVAAMATMRAGAAYVPVDISWPQAYRETVLPDECLKTTLNPLHLPVCDDGGRNSNGVLDASTPDGLAYMIFTSGTTGDAKGVMIPHRALANFAGFIVRRWHLDAQSRISCHSSLAFDASVEDLFPALTVGGTVYVMPESVRHDVGRIHDWIDLHQITGGCYTTQLGQMIARRRHPSLRYICLGGERMTVAPQATCRVFNTYGPTEFCVDATYYELEPGRDYGEIPIGRPLDNTAAYVVDLHGHLLPQGAVGELCLSGVQMADGYWKSPQLTAEKFTPCGFADGMLYHTGDLARWNDDGLLEFVGRIDHLVKVNGYRVSIEEVERMAGRLPQVSSACVVVVEHGRNQHLCAYFTSDADVDGMTLARQMREQCPAYMVPTEWVRLDAMPLRDNGKVDRRCLSQTSTRRREDCGDNVSEDERLVCDAYSRVLQTGPVGVDDDFFALGGTSLGVMNLMDELDHLGLKVEYGSVYRYPTPRQLMQHLVHGGSTQWKIDGDNRAIHRYLAGTAMPTPPYTSSSICEEALLTGGTGFLGIHVLRELLRQGRGRVCCLVRASSEEEALRRLDERSCFYFGQHLDTEMLSRISVVAGDLTDDSCTDSLSRRDFAWVFNCAANVRHFARANELSAVNTEAVRRLADLCEALHARLVHVSTLSVAGLCKDVPRRDVALTERDFYIGQTLADEYTYTKWNAERLLLERMADGKVDAVIMRVGNLSPRSYDGRFQFDPEQNSLAMTLRLFARLGSMPRRAEGIVTDISPVDVVAQSVVLLSMLHGVPVWHVAHPRRFSLREVLAMKGCQVESVDDAAFEAQMEKAKTDTATSRMALSMVGYGQMGDSLSPNAYSSSMTAEVLRNLGVTWP